MQIYSVCVRLCIVSDAFKFECFDSTRPQWTSVSSVMNCPIFVLKFIFIQGKIFLLIDYFEYIHFGRPLKLNSLEQDRKEYHHTYNLIT